MPRVLLATEGSRFAGIEAHLVNLIPAMQQAGDLEYHLALFDRGPLADRAAGMGVPVHFVLRRKTYDTSVIDNLRTIVKEQRIDLVHAHGYLANIVAGWACGRKKTPLVATVHGAAERFTGLAEIKMRLNLRLDRRMMRKRARAVITVAGFLKNELVQRGVPAEKITLVPNGVFDRPPDNQLRATNRAVLDLPPDAPAIAFAARLEPVKDPLAFVEFAQLVRRDLPRARFLVAGDGPLREAMHERVLALNLLPSFRFLGYLPDLDSFFNAADMLVLTSRSEGVPLVVLEAMRAQKPVLAPAVGGLPETLAGLGEATAPPGDVPRLAELAVRLLREPARLAAAGETARARFLAEFTAAHMAERTRQVYDRVLGANT